MPKILKLYNLKNILIIIQKHQGAMQKIWNQKFENSKPLSCCIIKKT